MQPQNAFFGRFACFALLAFVLVPLAATLGCQGPEPFSREATGGGGAGGATGGSGGATGGTGGRTGGTGGGLTGGTGGTGGSVTGGTGGRTGGTGGTVTGGTGGRTGGTGGSTTSSRISVLYKANPPSSNSITFSFWVRNGGTSVVDPSRLTVRYWFTADYPIANMVFECYYAKVESINVTATFGTVDPPRTNADAYVEIGFKPGVASLEAVIGDTGEVQVTLHERTNYLPLTESDDYSFDPTKTSPTAWERITAYLDGQRVYGIEPP